jgi:hypothetical protein
MHLHLHKIYAPYIWLLTLTDTTLVNTYLTLVKTHVGLQSLKPRCWWFFDNLVKLSQGVQGLVLS